MAAEWWWPSLLPSWLGSEVTWFLVLNVVVAAIAVLSSRARPSATPRRGGGVTRRASSVVLQRLRSFAIFSYPSACFDSPTSLRPVAAHAAAQATEKEPVTPPSMPMPSRDEEEEDPSVMSMEDTYALIMASRRPPEPEMEEEEEQVMEDLRQQRLNSIFNYTQMLKQRALGADRRQQVARRDQL